ncbi:MAG: MTAP family purine nucleoside phosphorylase [Candidatus Kuenenia sp.]|nr:MTAP family purine nucleoside phosphorylase [Candidatus Kuenenia hertensis]
MPLESNRKKTGGSRLVTLAVIGGSQAYDLLLSGCIKGKRLGEINTPYGLSQPIYLVQETNAEMLFLSRHGEKGYSITAPFVNYRANIYALKELGARQIVSWSGPGAINEKYKIGEYVLADDIIDETHGRESTFYKNLGIGFIRQFPVFCPTLRECILHTLQSFSVNATDKGTYVCTQGPRLETPAEIKKYKSYGGDLVGMTLVPEVFLAKELEMCYASICYVTNYAEGIVSRPFRAGELFEGLANDSDREAVKNAVSLFPQIIKKIAENIKRQKNLCQCQSLMERYKRRGDIGPDWHSWLAIPAH